jgi:Methylase involved in ubiquinone/menaquinone biosynthesis
MGSDYDSYVRTEWQMFIDNAARSRESLDAVAGLSVRRVLDVGCGAGQELIPFATKLGAMCVGIDAASEVGMTGRELFADCAPDARVRFARATAETLPFPENSFDVTICRLALPYTHNARCLRELARVLRPGGMLLLKIHHARYYTRKFREGLSSVQLLSALHAARVLLAGSIYHVTGRQPRLRFPSRETFQTVSLLRRELARCGLEIKEKMGDSNPLTPSFLILKREGVKQSART